MSVFTEERAALRDWHLSRALNRKCSPRGWHCPDPGVLIVSDRLYIQKVSALLLFLWWNERVRPSPGLFKLNGILKSTVIELHADNLELSRAPDQGLSPLSPPSGVRFPAIFLVHIAVNGCKVYFWWKGFAILWPDLTQSQLEDAHNMENCSLRPGN